MSDEAQAAVIGGGVDPAWVDGKVAELNAGVDTLSRLIEVLEDQPPSVFEAWSKVMEEVQSISKDSRNSQQNFNFRGIDAVMNAVGPALRKYGVTVVPTAISEESERYTTVPRGNNAGTPMINRVVNVAYAVIGPRGDSFHGGAFGEAADSGDKSMSKAMSVAYRTFLLQALTIPTDDPDPDSESHDRAPARAQTSNVRPAQQERPAQQQERPAQQAPAQEGENPKDPAHNRNARANLRAACEAKGIDLGAVAGLFKDRHGKPVIEADTEMINAFVQLIMQDLIQVAQ